MMVMALNACVLLSFSTAAGHGDISAMKLHARNTFTRLTRILVLMAVLEGCAFNPPLPEGVHPWTPDAIPASIWKGGSACIALSGGGLRSAAFSTGILQGLADAQLLQRSDYLSATSGGLYAASWLYNAVGRRSLPVTVALAPQGQEQMRLANGARNFVDKTWGISSAVSGGFIEPFWKMMKSWTCNGSDMGLVPSGGEFGYGNAIADLFLDKPYATWDRGSVSDLLNLKSLPKLVPTLTVVPGADPTCDSQQMRCDLESARAEISEGKLRTVSGIEVKVTDWPLAQVTAAAGAAIDISTEDTDAVKLCDVPGLFRPYLGSSFCASGRELKPSPKIWFATDGGFTDNIPIASLFDRKCQTIVAVDATHDPSMTFGDLTKQESGRISQEGLSLSEIMSEILGQKPEDKSEKNIFRADRVATPVGVSRSNDGRVLAVVKLALAAPTSGADTDPRLPSAVVFQYAKTKDGFDATGCRGSGLKTQCRFPQESTVRQDYSAEEFMAYRDLGHWIVREVLLRKLSEVGAISSPEN
jgi:predicted acylesterase/phospholipase RssA